MPLIQRRIAPRALFRVLLLWAAAAAFLAAFAPVANAADGFVSVESGELTFDTDDVADLDPAHTVYVSLLPEGAPTHWEVWVADGSVPAVGAGCIAADATHITCDLISNGGLADETLGAKFWLGRGDDNLYTGNQISGGIEAQGEEGTDALSGGEGADALYGGEGLDYLHGYDGSDFLSGGDGDFDYLNGGWGTDTYDGGLGFGDTVSYDDGRPAGVTASLDNIANDGDGENIGGSPGTLGIESVTGSENNDTLTGDLNSNTVRGMGGDDELYGMGGSDMIVGDYYGENHWGNPGKDFLSGGAGIDAFKADEDDDELDAEDGEADSALVCGAGLDTIYADAAGIDAASVSDCETVIRAGGVTPPSNTSPPVMSGPEAKVGVMLSGALGTWDQGGGTNTYIGKWLRCADLVIAHCQTIASGHFPAGSTYTITTADVNHRIIWLVEATNEAGSTPAHASHFTGVVPQPAPPVTAPVNVSPPVMSGPEAKVGAVLSGAVGTWTAGGGNNTYLGIWRRCADLILDNCETVWGGIYPEGSTYTVTNEDIGHRIIWAVAAMNEAGTTVTYAPHFSGVVPDPNAVPGSNGEGAGSPKVKPPVVDHTPAQKSSACQAKVNFGPIGVRGSCLKRVGLTWESSGEVNVNGIRLVPSGGSAKIVIDPMNLRISATGKASIIVGPANVGGRQLGPYTLWTGSFDWVFQPKIQLPDVPGLATALDYGKDYIGAAGLPANQSVSLEKFSYADLQKLPGLEGLPNLPRLSGLGLPDFSKVTVSDLKKLRIPTLDDVSKMQIPAYYLQNAKLPPLALDTKGANLFGFGLEGKAAMQLVDDGVNFNVALALKKFGNLSALADFTLTNAGTIRTGNIQASADEVNLGIFSLRPFNISYDGSRDSWAGKASVFLPFPNPTGIGADVRVEAGKLSRVGLSYDGNLAVGTTGVFMSHLDLTYDDGPPRNLISNVSLTAGPKLAKLPPAVELNGKFEYKDETATHYAFYRMSGNASLVGIPLGKALIEYYTNGYFHAKGSISYFLDSGNKYGIKGSIDGWATKTRFNLEGDVKFTTPGFSLEANALVSSTGIAGCATVDGGWFKGFSLGAGYKWRASSLDWLGGSCDLSKYRAVYNGKASLSAAGDFTRTVEIKKGERAASFAVRGEGAAPKVTLSGPGGLKVETPPGSLDGVQNDRFMLIQDDLADTTYVVVGKPTAGNWTISAQDGSVPVTGLDQAGALPAVSVKATLKGGKGAKTLSWNLKPQPGQKVRFVERADSVARVLTETNSAKGKVKFSPADGPKGKRYIEAVIEQDGMVRKTIVVARFVAPKPARPAAPRGLRVKRSKSRLIVTWKASKGADRYRVFANINGGRKTLVTTKGKQRRAVIEAVFPDTAATIRVFGVDSANRAGKAAKAKLKVKKIKKPKLNGLKKAAKKKKK